LKEPSAIERTGDDVVAEGLPEKLRRAWALWRGPGLLEDEHVDVE
jgi:hypothetical protein